MKRTIFTSLAVFLAGALFSGIFYVAIEATNTLSFCISCHEMESTVYREYRETAHFKGASGVQTICADCHVPKEWGPKLLAKVKASKDVWHWLLGTIGTKEKFEARRGIMAARVHDWMRRTNSQSCRNCHNFRSADLKVQARFARRAHKKAQKENTTCIDCHKGIAHHLPATKKTAIKMSDEDREYGEEINITCAGCHSEFGQGKPNGDYPRLAGLSAEYLAAQLRNFKSRHRLNIPMFPYTSERELPEEDVLIISAYLSNISLPSKLPPVNEQDFDALKRLRKGRQVMNIPRYSGNIAAGGLLYARECKTCHGKSGMGSPDGKIPPLTGQYSNYLKRQVQKFRKSERLHGAPEDAAIFRNFGDSEIRDMLAWLSVQDDS